jgi:hypothetical protein
VPRITEGLQSREAMGLALSAKAQPGVASYVFYGPAKNSRRARANPSPWFRRSSWRTEPGAYSSHAFRGSGRPRHTSPNAVSGQCTSRGLHSQVDGRNVGRLPGLIVVCFGRFWVRGLPFPNARHLGHPFHWKNTLPWRLGPTAKVRILPFKNLPPFQHYRGLQNHL